MDYSLLPEDQEAPYGQGLRLKRAVAATRSPGGVLTNNVQTGEALSGPAGYRDRAATLYQQGNELYNSEPDMTALQNYARQRGQEGDGAMLNALAAQFAGERFEPVQAQYLKKASAARDPMKLAGGMITADGQFIKDPFAQQDKRAEFLLNQAKAYEQMAASAETAQQRAAAQAAQNDMNNQLRMMGIQIQQGRLDYLNNKEPDNTKTFRAEDTLRNDFDKITKDLRDELQATSKITDIVRATPPGKTPDAITQQSLVILLNKFLDPGSVVREGEFDRVVQAQGLIGQAQNLKDRILFGKPLDANTIQQINGLADMYSKAATAKIQSVADNYSDIATRRGLDVNNVISEPKFRRSPAARQSGSAPAPGTVQDGYRFKGGNPADSNNWEKV
jgi:hypothetical protein